MEAWISWALRPEVVCTRHNLEVAVGLGSLHCWEGFMDDPAHDPHRGDTRSIGR
jgi:hypothetical protein